MGHVYTKLWVHAVFAVSKAQPLLLPPVDTKVHNYLHEQLLELGCPTRIINGMPDHLHLLFLQHPSRSMAEIVRRIKGNSSNWINQQRLCAARFSWQPGYAAFSVSESQVQRVFDYIRHQRQHHGREDYQKEYSHIIALHGLKPTD
jgi:REP element-mobilizing transposase RayT